MNTYHYSRRKLILTAFVFTLLMFSTCLTKAAVVFVENHSFEQDVTPDGKFPVGGGLPSGWTIYDPSNIYSQGGNFHGVVNPNEAFFTTNNGASDSEVPIGQNVPDGVNAALIWLNSNENQGTPAGIRQVLTETLQANTLYELSVGVGNIGSGLGANGIDYDLRDFPGYSVELWVGDQMLAQDLNTLNVPEREWRTSEISFTSGDSVTPDQQLEIRLINLDINDPAEPGPGIEVDFDNVILNATAVTPVPEPNCFILCALGVVPLLLMRKRHSKNKNA